MNSDKAAQSRFELSLRGGQMLSDGLRFAAGEASASLVRQAKIAGCRSVEEYIYNPAWTWPKPPPPPIKAEIKAAFFALSEWTKGSRKTNGIINNKAGKRVSLPTKAEMEFILEKAKERKIERMTDDEIIRLIRLFNEIEEASSDSKDDVVDPDVEAVKLMREYWEIVRRHRLVANKI